MLISGRGEIKNFNNRIASNLLICAYHFNNVYKILLPVFCFLFVVTVCAFFRKCLNTLLKQNKSQKLRLEFYHKLLSSLYLAILSNYLTWCISITLLSSDIDINLVPKSSSRECLPMCHWSLNSVFLKLRSMQGWTATTKHGVKRKRITKRPGLCQKYPGLGTCSEGSQWSSGQSPRKYLAIWHL